MFYFYFLSKWTNFLTKELKLSVIYFDNNEAIDTYVQDEHYGDQTTRICFGIAFTDWSPPHYEYSIR